jgi:toxin CcdB
MAQFDVCENIGASKETVPFVVILQSSLFDQYRRRLVAPLVLKKSVSKEAFSDKRVFPVFRVKGRDVVLNPLDLVSVALPQIGPFVGSLADSGQTIQDALDEVFSRTWG